MHVVKSHTKEEIVLFVEDLLVIMVVMIVWKLVPEGIFLCPIKMIVILFVMEFILEFPVEFVVKYLKSILRVIGVMKRFHSLVILELISPQSNGQLVSFKKKKDCKKKTRSILLIRSQNIIG